MKKNKVKEKRKNVKQNLKLEKQTKICILNKNTTRTNKVND